MHPKRTKPEQNKCTCLQMSGQNSKMNNLTEISLTADVTTRRIPALKCIQPVVSAFKDK